MGLCRFLIDLWDYNNSTCVRCCLFYGFLCFLEFLLLLPKLLHKAQTHTLLCHHFMLLTLSYKNITYICMPSKLHNYIYIFIAYICDIEIAQRSIKWPIDFKVSGSRFKLLQTLTHGPSVVWPIFYYEDRHQNLVQRYLPKNKWPDWFGGNRSRFKHILQII